MRALFLAALATGALAAYSTSPAQATSYPYCMKGQDYGANGDCSFPSYAACAAAASGTYSYCVRNPFFALNAYPDTPRRKGRYVYPGQGY
ncbi:MAG: DUF3551 domain-containing protein [Bradyrhizobiaceae bacterium]|nr:MAG: DUF3551 domain-containing protein [Bradyrhizobiaceae bacterium]